MCLATSLNWYKKIEVALHLLFIYILDRDERSVSHYAYLTPVKYF